MESGKYWWYQGLQIADIPKIGTEIDQWWISQIWLNTMSEIMPP